MKEGTGQLDLRGIRLKLQAAQGKRYWRSLEEIAQTPEFERMLHREFPERSSEWLDSFSRRNFLKVMSASLALAGLTSCTKEPQGRIVPYVRPPANVVPGRPLFFASTMPIGGVGYGVLVESHEGRPTKIEGNSDHPASLGAASVFMQASILSLYDPDRSQVVTHKGQAATWSAFETAIAAVMETARQNKGAGLRILTESVSSPTLVAQLEDLLKALPEAKWHTYEPVSRQNTHGGTQIAFGRKLDPVYHFKNTDVILSLDGDFLFAEPGSLRYARFFADKRRTHARETGNAIDAQAQTMNRLYVAESTPTITGAMADHRLPLKPTEIGALAAALAREVGATGFKITAPPLDAASADWIKKVAKDFTANKGKGLVLAGESQPAMVHAIVHSINAALGNIGHTVQFIEPIDAYERANNNPPQSARTSGPADSLSALVDEMHAGKVDTLIVLGGNPRYNAPADLNFAEAFDQVPLRIHLGEYNDETGLHSHWHLPQAHYLEAWGDVRAFNGTISIIQPLIAPLYQGKSAHELLSILAGQPAMTGYESVRAYWSAQKPAGDFEAWWKSAVQNGVIDGSMSPNVQVPAIATAELGLAAPTAGGIELIFRPDYSVWDGRFANNGWLQEVARPLTHLVWDNAGLISPGTAHKYDLENGDIVTVTSGDRKLDVPVWILPGQPNDTVALHLGYGRTRAGRVGGMEKETTGFNAYLLRTSQTPWFATGATIRKTGAEHHLVATHTHHSIEERKLDHLIEEPEVIARPEHGKKSPSEELNNRKLIRVATLSEYKADPFFAPKMDEEGDETEAAAPGGETPHRRVQLQLFPEWDYSKKHKWGMSIDTNSCIGCNACVIACQAENSTPVVGKDQCERGREMHWIRVDTYFGGNSLDNPETYFEPIPCMHCENAPCELVCPVAATVHDDEGINNMIYNRCVGTRYCSNNCPYKVRRFNFLEYSGSPLNSSESQKLQRNPEVTVRSRGIMEKCTYCIQRINNTRIEFEKEELRIEEQGRKSGEPVEQVKSDVMAAFRNIYHSMETACQQSCPTEAIIFGDINDPSSRVARTKESPLDFGLLKELTTKPRTTYLARLRNPNPEMV